MIRSSVGLKAMLGQGRTVARLCEMTGATAFRWVMADTNEPVHASAVNRLAWTGDLTVIATDLCGDPIQVGAAHG